MADKETNLHPKNNPSIDLKPNIVTGNIPDKAVTLEKLDQTLQEKISTNENAISSLKNSVNYINNELINPLIDLLPHIPVCYKQGGIDNTTSTRISTPNYIKVDGYKRLYVEYTGTALAEMYIDAYTGTEGNYVHFLGYGYYSANNVIGIASNSITAIKITFRKPDNSDITPLEIDDLTKNLRVYLTDNAGLETTLPIKLRIMQYNIGKFNYGESGGLSTNVETKILNYKKFLAQYRPDICCLEEYPMDNYTGYIPTIDSGGQYYPDEVIFDNLYYYKTQGYFGVEQKANIKNNSVETFSINVDDVTYRTKGILTTYKIHNKTVGLINGWFNVSAPVENRLAQFNDCIARLQNYDIGIICVDSNVASQTELDNLNSIAKAAGYVCANGGYFGYFETLSPYVSLYKCVDQVWVKGAKIVNAERPDVYSDLSSDHLPLLVDIVIE